MAGGTKEIDLEKHVADYLTREIAPGTFEYTIRDTSSYDKELCLIPEDLFGFLEDTQGDKLAELYKQYGANTHQKVVQRVAEELKKNKTHQVLREKVKDRGQNLDLVYFKPNHNKSPEHAEWYDKNRLTIIRQLKYSRANENSIDIVIFINGIPILTMELKMHSLANTYIML